MPETVSQLGLEAQRRRKLAEALQSQNQSPVTSNLGGLAHVLNQGLAAWQTRKADEIDKQKTTAQNETLAAALDPTRKREELPQILAKGGYEDAAIKMATEKPPELDLKEQAESALIAQAGGQQLSPQQTAALQAFDKLRQTEMMYDPRQNIVPKYQSLTGGSQPAAQPSAQPVPSQQPHGDLLPPPSGVGQPDMSLFNKPSMPQGLDPKAQGQYMDAMAASAAERAANGGIPKMTETQSAAASRSTLMNNGLRGMTDALTSGNVSGLNMAIADTAQKAGPLGEFASNMIRTPEEQKFSASKSAALESMASAVTGAGVTNDQFGRFSNMLPTGSETPEVQKFKIANAYEFLLTQTKVAGPVAEELRNEVMRLRNEQAAPAAPAATPYSNLSDEELLKVINGAGQ